MADDDITLRGPADRAQINVKDDYQIRYWTVIFGCTQAQLRTAVAAVGTDVDQVERYLKDKE